MKIEPYVRMTALHKVFICGLGWRKKFQQDFFLSTPVSVERSRKDGKKFVLVPTEVYRNRHPNDKEGPK